MAILGRTVYRLEESPAREIGLNDADGEPIPGAAVLLRLLPRAVSEELIRPAMRKVRRSAKDEDAAADAISDWMKKHTAAALVDTKGFEWSFDDAGAAEAYRAFFPDLEVGVAVSFDGKWTDALKKKFFDDHPAVVSLIVEAYKRLAAIGSQEKREEEEGKGRTSSAGLASD